MKTGPPVARLSAIVLAAGSGSRYGGPKQLAERDGVPLVRRAAELAIAACPGRVVLVTGAHADAVAAAVDRGRLAVAYNPRWADGLATSLQHGLDALAPDTTACLVLLADQAAITHEDLGRLCAAWSVAPTLPAAARYADTLGVPAIFPASDWRALRALSGDRGGRAVLAQLPQVTAVPMPNAQLDVDVPADLGR